ncbi:hypothetical protein [Helicobacter pylori]|uniref:hypothetical protein n=1 Tax=Helicobacter pylori TaxID=210 RepID=UPI001FD5FC0B|nr:hypothetical protein [Helicobacter pylori]UOS18731.1 hypothetical protein MPG30_00445 [Helicobacter pylori]
MTSYQKINEKCDKLQIENAKLRSKNRKLKDEVKQLKRENREIRNNLDAFVDAFEHRLSILEDKVENKENGAKCTPISDARYIVS